MSGGTPLVLSGVSLIVVAIAIGIWWVYWGQESLMKKQEEQAATSKELSPPQLAGFQLKRTVRPTRCLTKSDKGVGVFMSGCSDTRPEQRFTMDSEGHLKSGDLCLDPVNLDEKDGTPLIMWDCHGGNAGFKQTTTGQIRWRDKWCVDVPVGNDADGSHLQLWSCMDNNDNQKFTWT